MKKGFTLIELIITIVLLGIVAGLGVNLISTVFTGYSDTKIKSFLFYEAKFTVERIDRELRVAIPNTIRNPNNDNSSIQFGELKNAGYYDNITNDNITIYGVPGIKTGKIISIYNLNPKEFYNEQRIYNVDDNASYPTLILNKKIQKKSPYNRFFILATPVTFYFNSSKHQIIRCFDYPVNDPNFGETTGECNVLTNYVKSVSFQYQPGVTWRSGIVKIDLTLEKKGLILNYKHEVHIRNVP